MRARLSLRAPGRPALLLLLPLAAIAAGCGGSTKSASGSTTTTVAGRSGSGPAAAARAKFTSCLEAHGVPANHATQGFRFRRAPGSDTTESTSASLPSTPPSTSAAYAAAFQACRADLPARPAGGFQNSAAGRAYLQCLQVHGVTRPSTPPTSGPPGSAGAPGGDYRSLTSDPAFQAARTACAPLAPNRTGGSGSTSTTAAP